MKHVGLFEGIGGFSLAAQWCGWETTAWCEIDPFCQKVLRKNFSKSFGFGDIKKFDYPTYKSVLRHHGIRDRAIDIITGGFPCQPFSIAGKREGEKDERFLWAEFDRIVGETKPMVVVAENVSGLLTIQDGLVFERVCTDLENRGYEVQTFIIPACAVGAPHRRDRVWIVAKNTVCNGRECNGHQEKPSLGQFGNVSARNGEQFYNETPTYASCRETEWEIGQRVSTMPITSNRDASNSNSKLLEGCKEINGREKSSEKWTDIRIASRTDSWGRNWHEVAAEFCRVDDGVSRRLDRSSRLKALGNAIVPQVAYQIFQSL